jgi:pseudouridine-5'-phosphate glycosidase
MRVVKTSRRDFPYVLGQRLNGGTTVSGTIICSQICGIKVFATGGIGGVHRDGENSMDISADLIEMGRSNVAVVSSGIKSILDIPRTMEYLETQGVAVSTFQVPDCEFPAFYTRKSGVKAPYNFNDAHDAAKCISKSLQLGLNSGFLIAVPVPEEFAMDGKLI